MGFRFFTVFIVLLLAAEASFAQYYPSVLASSSSAYAPSGSIDNEGEVVLSRTPSYNGAVVWLPQADHSYSSGFNTISVPTGWAIDSWVANSTNDHLDIVGGAYPTNAKGPGDIDYIVANFGDSFSSYSAGFNAVYGPTTPIVFGINNLHQIISTDDWSWDIWLPSAAYGLPAGRSRLVLGGDPSAINDSGQIAGGYNSSGFGPGQQAELWLPTAAYGLGAGFHQIGPTGSNATNLNDNGQVTLNLNYQSISPQAAIWLPTSAFGLPAGLTNIGPLDSNAIGININGQVVGTYSDNGVTHAFLWDPVAGFEDLNNLINPASGITITAVLGINDFSEILADGTYNGGGAVFLLSLPEPSLALLAAIPLLALARRSSRRI